MNMNMNTNTIIYFYIDVVYEVVWINVEIIQIQFDFTNTILQSFSTHTLIKFIKERIN